MKLIELKGIAKHFHANTALKKIDLYLEEGESLTVLGPNGAGKSTLLKIISGVMSPSEGKIIYGDEVSSGSPMSSEVSFLGHKNSLYNALTVLENVQFVNRLFRRRNGKARTEHFLKTHGLWERRNDPVRELSQGMKRRLAIVKGFISTPKLFIMDEPFTGLDLKWRSAVLSNIKDFREEGNSLVLSTHLVEEGYELADRIAFLRKGKLLFLKRKEEVNIEDIKKLFHALEKG